MVCTSAVSTNSPTAKPKTAPGSEPHSRPTEAMTSGVRSALVPNSRTWETAATWMTTTRTPRRAARNRSCGVSGGMRSAVVVGLLGHHLAELDPPQVHERLQVDLLRLGARLVDARDAADREVGRVGRRERV